MFSCRDTWFTAPLWRFTSELNSLTACALLWMDGDWSICSYVQFGGFLPPHRLWGYVTWYIKEKMMGEGSSLPWKHPSHEERERMRERTEAPALSASHLLTLHPSVKFRFCINWVFAPQSEALYILQQHDSMYLCMFVCIYVRMLRERRDKRRG